MFTRNNTEGYTDQQLDLLNKELQEYLDQRGPAHDELTMDRLAKEFTDIVARR